MFRKVVSWVKYLELDIPAKQKGQVQSLGWEDPLEEEMAPHSSTLSWKIPWTGKPGGYSPWSHKELDTAEHTPAAAAYLLCTFATP